MLLLDTQVLIWWLMDDKRLGRHAGARIEKAWPKSLSMCAASWYELAAIHNQGRIRLSESPSALRARILNDGLSELGVEGAAAIDGAQLDGISRDPIDRMIVATARRHNAALVTSDESILAWPGKLDRLDARR